MRTLDYVGLTLVSIGALNWGLIVFFNFDLVSTLFNGGLAFVGSIIFAVVGLAGLYSLSLYGRMDYTEKIHQMHGAKR
ncbi:MAG: DUF378 domain-containing protein [Lachnospiraceae bacterium]|nr:DUF378 domain-containing protein [Lachnospiraceae bacterium]